MKFNGTIIIVTHNSEESIESCLSSLQLEAQELKIKVVVVDNLSEDQTTTLVKDKFPWVLLIENQENGGFGAGNNVGLGQVEGDWVFFLNPDTTIQRNCVKNLLQVLEQEPQIGCVAPAILNQQGQVQLSVDPLLTVWTSVLKAFGLDRLLPLNKYSGRWVMTRQSPVAVTAVDRVLGAAMLIPIAALKKVGGFDERFFLYSEEEDLCYRLHQENLRIFYVPTAHVTHAGAVSTEKMKPLSIAASNWSRYLYLNKHFGSGGAQFSRYCWVLMLWLRLIVVSIFRSGANRKNHIIGYKLSIRSLCQPDYFDRQLRPSRSQKQI